VQIAWVEVTRFIMLAEQPNADGHTRDERWVCSPFTLIAACRKDIKNGLLQNLSSPFTTLEMKGGYAMLSR
jgi:hypothetical protein